MSVDLDPDQPEPVAALIARLLDGPEPAVDPWWAAGLAEALRRGDSAAAEDAWRGAGVVEP